MLVRDIMTRNVEVIFPGDTLKQAARKMEELNVGPLPVYDGRRVVGMLTDRDVSVRATAAGCDPKTTLVGDAMSQEVVRCYEDQDVQEAARLMKERQVRRLLVMNRSNQLVGIVLLGDLATEAGEQGQPAEVLKEVFEPT
jgi:CBS domain-containing protein